MKKTDLVKKTKERARRTKRLRKDARYQKVLGFLIQMGFLYANETFPRLGNQRIPIKDAIWAGVNVEPRILEVLPAAVARLPKRFDYKAGDKNELDRVIRHFLENQPTGPDFMGIPYEKLRTWYQLPLRDRRTKTPTEKKIACNFRLSPKALAQLNAKARAAKISQTALLEKMILSDCGPLPAAVF